MALGLAMGWPAAEGTASAQAGAPCSLSIPPGAPVRFLTCSEGGDEVLWAVATGNDHCVPAASAPARAATFTCGDGVVVQVDPWAAGELGACSIAGDVSASSFLACTIAWR